MAQATLKNALRLIVQPETISRAVTRVGRVTSEPDLAEPKGQDGVHRVLADGFDRGVQLLAEDLRHPALPASARWIRPRGFAQVTLGPTPD